MSDIVRERLLLILESLDLIQERMVSVREAQDFVSTSSGVVMMDSIALRLQTIGENVKKIERVEPELLARFSDVNWNRVIRFRDMISHHYEKTDYEILFNICTEHLAPLRKVIVRMLESTADSNAQ